MYVLDLIEMHGNFIKFLDCIMTENYFVCKQNFFDVFLNLPKIIFVNLRIKKMKEAVSHLNFNSISISVIKGYCRVGQ